MRVQTSLAIALFGTVLLSCGDSATRHSPPLLQGAVTPVPGTPRCPSFQDLGVQVDRRVAAIKPGVTLKEFTSNGIAHALNFWDPAAGGLRETVFLVSAREGNALVSDSLVCQFDREDRLVGCQQACCRRESRTISLEQYNSLRIGEPRSATEHRLCSPSNGDSLGVPGVEPEGPHGVKTYYHIPLPLPHHDEGQGVMLVFDENRLSFKGMSLYY